MLPGLRFLFAATLICTSLLMFGMGAIALLRASHQQFASLPPRQPPEPVFAQAPQTVPSLSMLRVEPAPAAPVAVPAPQREASLTNAERGAEALPPPPVIMEPKAPDPSTETRSDTKPPADPPQMPEVPPLAEKPTTDAPVAVADAPIADPKAPEAAAPDTAPAVEAAAAPQTASPDAQISLATGSIAMPEDQPVDEQAVAADPPLPQPRPEVAALPPKIETAPPKSVAKPVVKRKIRHAKRHRPKSEKLPAATSAPSLSSLFGGSN